MDRSIVYASQQPTADTWLGAERAKMVALGFLSQAVLGSNTVIDGLACTPTTPASLAVNIGAGSIYTMAPVDSSTYSALAADPTTSILKQGILSASTAITLTPPSTSGYAINYLIQAAFSEIDTDSLILPYFNSANPLVPLSGPAGSGTSQPTWRRGRISIVAKAGIAASAGSQITPSPDAGYVGICVVTVANGATQLTSSNISSYSAAPKVGVKLPDVPKWVQGSSYSWGVDVGTANAIVAIMDPVVTAYTPGLRVTIKKINSANTGAMTIDVGAGAVSLRDYTGAVLNSGAIPAGSIISAVYNGSTFNMIGGNASYTSVTNLTANSGDGVEVTAGGLVNFRVSRGTQDNTVNSGDLWPRGDAGDGTCRYMTTSDFISWARGAVISPTIAIAEGSGPQSVTIAGRAGQKLLILTQYEGSEDTVGGWPTNYIVGSLTLSANGTQIASKNIRCHLNWIDIWSAGRQNLTARAMGFQQYEIPSAGNYTFTALAKNLSNVNFSNPTSILVFGV